MKKKKYFINIVLISLIIGLIFLIIMLLIMHNKFLSNPTIDNIIDSNVQEIVLCDHLNKNIILLVMLSIVSIISICFLTYLLIQYNCSEKIETSLVKLAVANLINNSTEKQKISIKIDGEEIVIEKNTN